MGVTVQLVGDDTVQAKFAQMRQEARTQIVAAISRLAIDLQTKVVSEKLSGQVLNVRTGTLRRSITERVEDNGDVITGIVGANLDAAKYAAAQEYGFQGTVSVKEYTRRMTQAWGRPIAEKMVTVQAHSMRMNLPARSYLRSSLREMSPEIFTTLRDAIGTAQADVGL